MVDRNDDCVPGVGRGLPFDLLVPLGGAAMMDPRKFDALVWALIAFSILLWFLFIRWLFT